VKFTELSVTPLVTAPTVTADPPDRTDELNNTLDIVTDPPSADTNTNPSVDPVVLGVNVQLVSVSVDPLHRNTDVCDPPSDVPTTNFSCENVEVPLDVTSPTCDPDSVPILTSVFAALPATVVLTLPSEISPPRLLVDSTKMFRVADPNRVTHT
jgi:hypothetical protein